MPSHSFVSSQAERTACGWQTPTARSVSLEMDDVSPRHRIGVALGATQRRWKPTVILAVTLGLLLMPVAPAMHAVRAQEVAETNQPSEAVEPLTLVFPYGSEKDDWLQDVTRRFHERDPRLASGRPIRVRLRPMGSGEVIDAALSDQMQPHVISPASSVYLELGEFRSQKGGAGRLVIDPVSLVRSPVVIAMWEPMARVLGWPDRPIGWGELLDLSSEPGGWAALGFAEWGPFKMAHTHPEHSNSGLLAVLAEIYAVAGKTDDLSPEDLRRLDVINGLKRIERSMIHYGRSTGFFGKTLARNGPDHLSAAVVYENMVIESRRNTSAARRFPPLVAIYPAEGTFWCDHPAGLVNRPWVTAEHREAWSIYRDALMSAETQTIALKYGFRPGGSQSEGDRVPPLLSLTAPDSPFSLAYGVDPEQPRQLLEVPRAQVVEQVLDLWRACRKTNQLILALDLSQANDQAQPGPPTDLDAMKQTARDLVNQLGDDDEVTLLTYDHQPRVQFERVLLKWRRDEVLERIASLTASNRPAALREALAEVSNRIRRHSNPTKITSVVILNRTDSDRNSRLTQDEVLRTIRQDFEITATRIFALDHASDPNAAEKNDQSVLLNMVAELTGAWYRRLNFHAIANDSTHELVRELATSF